MRIYTRHGDGGSTGLYGGRRVSKAGVRVAAYGSIDETSATIGWARAAGLPDAIDQALDDVQETCFRLGAWLAAQPGSDPGVAAVDPADVEQLERAIDAFEPDLPPLKHFLVPGGCEGGARLHLARTVARRAERAAVELARGETVDAATLAWLNRLSDLLFVLARAANVAAGVPERSWNPRGEGRT